MLDGGGSSNPSQKRSPIEDIEEIERRVRASDPIGQEVSKNRLGHGSYPSAQIRKVREFLRRWDTLSVL